MFEKLNARFANVDIENASCLVVSNVRKIICLVNDLHEYFYCRDGESPSTEKLEDIRVSFEDIGLRLFIIDDMLDNINAAMQPIEDAL